MDLTWLQMGEVHALVQMTLPKVDEWAQQCHRAGLRLRSVKVDAPSYVPSGETLAVVGNHLFSCELIAR